MFLRVYPGTLLIINIAADVYVIWLINVWWLPREDRLRGDKTAKDAPTPTLHYDREFPAGLHPTGTSRDRGEEWLLWGETVGKRVG